MAFKLWTQDLYQKAVSFAADAHADQKVPGTERPYLTHLANVAMEVMTAVALEGVGDPDLAVVCALLHDTVEDAGVLPEEISGVFGENVCNGVVALSKNPELEKNMQLQDSLHRIKLQPREVWIVKLADRITNLQPAPHYWTQEKKIKYRDEALLILSELGSASMSCSERLRNKIENYIL